MADYPRLIRSDEAPLSECDSPVSTNRSTLRSPAIKSDPSSELPIYLKPDEAASLLRTTRKAIYVMIERRQLPGVKRVGRRVLIRTQSLLEWLDQECASSLQKEQQR